MYEALRTPYLADNNAKIHIGGIVVDEQLIDNAPAHIVLKSLTRHGLIAGATGSGKTKTIQVLCEQLSLAGVPCFVMDIKGDVSGLAMPGQRTEFIQNRSDALNLTFTPRALPVELLTLSSDHQGVTLRSTVSDFGAVLFARMLDLNETQSGVLSVVFQYAKEEQIPLIDLDDLKSILQFVQMDEIKPQFESRYGAIASSSIGTIIRSIIELEAQGGNDIFGLPAFEVSDFVRVDTEGHGVISILRLLDMQDKPKLFSSFMLKLLSDLYREMPESGDLDKPKLVLFIDEAHLIFNQASKALLSLLDTMVKLIRSKGVGLIFCTQTPDDIPENVLSQLGLKIQHSLRAFTAKDRKAIKLVAQNFPPSEHYQTDQLLTSLSIGDALVSALDSKGLPMPLIQCRLRAPESRMGVLTTDEIHQILTTSGLYSKYHTKQKAPSAKTILAEKQPVTATSEKTTPEQTTKEEPSIVTSITKNTLFRQIIRQIARDLLRSLMVVLGIKKR